MFAEQPRKTLLLSEDRNHPGATPGLRSRSRAHACTRRMAHPCAAHPDRKEIECARRAPHGSAEHDRAPALRSDRIRDLAGGPGGGSELLGGHEQAEVDVGPAVQEVGRPGTHGVGEPAQGRARRAQTGAAEQLGGARGRLGRTRDARGPPGPAVPPAAATRPPRPASPRRRWRASGPDAAPGTAPPGAPMRPAARRSSRPGAPDQQGSDRRRVERHEAGPLGPAQGPARRPSPRRPRPR